MHIYSLTSRGETLAHSYRNPSTPAWKVIHFLNRRGKSTREQILENVPDATSVTLFKLMSKHIIMEETGVNV